MAVDTSQFQRQIHILKESVAHKIPKLDHSAGCKPSQGGHQDIAGEEWWLLELNGRGDGEKLADQWTVELFKDLTQQK